MNEKMNAAQQESYPSGLGTYPHPISGGLSPAKDCCEASFRPTPTVREQHEKSIGYLSDQINKHDRARAFFANNPAFDEFIQLVRDGAISIWG